MRFTAPRSVAEKTRIQSAAVAASGRMFGKKNATRKTRQP